MCKFTTGDQKLTRFFLCKAFRFSTCFPLIHSKTHRIISHLSGQKEKRKRGRPGITKKCCVQTVRVTRLTGQKLAGVRRARTTITRKRADLLHCSQRDRSARAGVSRDVEVRDIVLVEFVHMTSGLCSWRCNPLQE